MNDQLQDDDQARAATGGAGVFAGYKGGEEMPLAGYAGLLGAFSAGLIGVLLAAENVKREKEERASVSFLQNGVT